MDLRIFFQCNECKNNHAQPRYFDERQAFVNHIRRFCHICGIDFTSEYSTDSHRRSHHNAGAEQHLCSLCGRLFPNKVYLDHHQKDHFPYGCIGCIDASFHSFDAVIKHSKDYCQGIDESLIEFRKKPALISHPCHGCGWSSDSIINLYLHFKNCHKSIEKDMANVSKENRKELMDYIDYSLEKSYKHTPELPQYKTMISAANPTNNNVASTSHDFTLKHPSLVKEEQVLPSTSGTTNANKVSSKEEIHISDDENDSDIEILEQENIDIKDMTLNGQQPHEENIVITGVCHLPSESLKIVLGEELIKAIDMMAKFVKTENVVRFDISEALQQEKALMCDKKLMAQFKKLPSMVFFNEKVRGFVQIRVVDENSLEQTNTLELIKKKVDLTHHRSGIFTAIMQLCDLKEQGLYITESLNPYPGRMMEFRSYCRNSAEKDDIFKVYRCRHCLMNFAGKQNMIHHLNHYCHDCQGELDTPTLFIEHILKVHCIKASDPLLHYCPFCGQAFSASFFLARHIFNRHVELLKTMDRLEGVPKESPYLEKYGNNVLCRKCRRVLSDLEMFVEHESAGCKQLPLDEWYFLKVQESTKKVFTGQDIVTATNAENVIKLSMCPFCALICVTDSKVLQHLRVQHQVLRIPGSSGHIYEVPSSPSESAVYSLGMVTMEIQKGRKKTFEIEEDKDDQTEKSPDDWSGPGLIYSTTMLQELRVLDVRKTGFKQYALRVSAIFSNGKTTIHRLNVRLSFLESSNELICDFCKAVVNHSLHFDLYWDTNNVLHVACKKSSGRKTTIITHQKLGEKQKPIKHQSPEVELLGDIGDHRPTSLDLDVIHVKPEPEPEPRCFVFPSAKNYIPRHPPTPLDLQPAFLETFLTKPCRVKVQRLPAVQCKAKIYSGNWEDEEENDNQRCEELRNLTNLPIRKERSKTGKQIIGRTDNGWLEEGEEENSPLDLPERLVNLRDLSFAGKGVPTGERILVHCDRTDGKPSRSQMEPPNKRKCKGTRRLLNLDGQDDNSSDSDDEVMEVKNEADPLSVSHNALTFFKCTDCNPEIQFNTKDSSLSHVIFYHMKYCCSVCDIVFDNSQEKSLHEVLLHGDVSCDSCDKLYDTQNECNLHRFVTHKVYKCSFCTYIVPEDSVEIHITKNHRIQWNLFSVEKVASPNFEVIYNQTKLSAKCGLCLKKVPRVKIFGHLRYHHNLQIGQVIEMLHLVGFTINPDWCDKLPNVVTKELRMNDESQRISDPTPKIELTFEDKSLLCPLPKHDQDYQCPVPECHDKSQSDCGFHLLLEHGLFYCRRCNLFFRTQEHLTTHWSTVHKSVRERCSVCQGEFLDLVMLIEHRERDHSMMTCILCDLIFTAKPQFHGHVKNFHAVVNKNFTSHTVSITSLLESFDLVRLEDQAVACNLCEGSVIERKNSKEVWSHLFENHNIHSFEWMFSMFTGKSFTLAALKNSSNDDNTIFIDGAAVSENVEGTMTPTQSSPTSSNEVHKCIVCKEEFDTSLLVQQHLLANHMAVTKGSKIVEETDEATVKQAAQCDEDEPKEKKNVEVKEEQISDSEMDKNRDNVTYKAEDDYMMAKLEPEVELSEPSDAEVETDSAQASPSKSGPKLSLTCPVCSETVTSMFAFTQHMKREHPDSEYEKNKPFRCNICDKSFYFEHGLHSHKSKAHREIDGETHKCPFCPTVTCSKASMKRHLKKSHGSVYAPNGEFCHKCWHCEKFFWSIGERTKHIAEEHKEVKGDLEKCLVCHHISPNKNALRRHYLRMHPNEPLLENVSYKCATCGLMFPKRLLLNDHIKVSHPDNQLYQCSVCDSQLKTKRSMENHMRQHKKKESYSFNCDDCGKDFDTKGSLTIHKRMSHKEKRQQRVSCRLCDQKFDTIDARKIHYKTEHESEKPFECEVCGKGFINKSSCFNHKKTHHKKDVLLTCNYCNKQFNRRDSFNEHLLIHNGPRYKCPHCPKEFVQKTNLNRHVRIHLGIRPYKCTQCEMTFSDKGACNSHMRIHSGAEKEACQYCGKMFSRKQKLRYHLRLHTGEGLLTCEICGKVFTHTYAMKAHLKLHSGATHACSQCKEVFSNEKALRKHLETHESLGKVCETCGQSFRSLSETNTHILAAHSKGGYRCRYCEAHFFGLTDIREHLLQTHQISTDIAMHYINDYRNEVPFPLYVDDPIANPPEEKPSKETKHGLLKIKLKKCTVRRCSKCSSTFPLNRLLKIHLENFHPDLKVKCDICGFKNPSILRLNQHLLNNHCSSDNSSDIKGSIEPISVTPDINIGDMEEDDIAEESDETDETTENAKQIVEHFFVKAPNEDVKMPIEHIAPPKT